MEIFENLALMYGQNFKNFPQNVRTASGMGPKSQNLFGLSIRPPKNPNLFGRGHQAPKTANFRSDWPFGLKNGITAEVYETIKECEKKRTKIYSQYGWH